MSDSNHRTGKPVGMKPTGERTFGKPATGADGGKPAYSKPSFGKPAGERTFGKPATGAGSGKPAYGKPSFGKPAGERTFGKPATGAGSGKPAYDKPSFGKPAGERTFGKPATGAGSGKPAYGKPSFGKPAGERTFGKPAAGAGSEKPAYGKPSFGKPASGEHRAFKPAGAKPFAHRHDERFMPKATERRYAQPTESSGLSETARRLALEVLQDVHQRGAYASLALQERLSRSKLAPVDRRLATSIVYSTLESQTQLDFALDRLMDHPTSEPTQRDILRLSACQILFHDRVPDSAAVNEGVNLARKLGMESAAGFLNAVLRNLVRGKDEIPWPKRGDDLREYLRVMTSTPLWIVDRLIAAYGEETAEKLLCDRSGGREMVVRPNLMKLDDAAFDRMLAAKDWSVRPGVAPHARLVGGVTDVRLDDDYRKGLFSIQGQSSMLAALTVQAKPGMHILDACAAPGGKSCYMAEQMQGTGRVYAWELHEKRALLLESAKRRLQLENLRITVRDALEPKPDSYGTMDAVLLDAPCSGLGVIREKPDLKFRVQETDLSAIVETQRKLLDALCLYIKPGGTLVYSTCSLLPEENVQQVAAFVERHHEFAVEPLPLDFPSELRAHQNASGLQLLNYRDGVESFFIARLRRARG